MRCLNLLFISTVSKLLHPPFFFLLFPPSQYNFSDKPQMSSSLMRFMMLQERHIKYLSACGV